MTCRAFCAALFLLGGTRGALAEAPHVRVVVRVSTPLDLAVVERLEGHTSDLDVALQIVPRAPGPLHAQSEDASALVRAQGVDAVLWLSRVEDRYLIFASPVNQPPVLLSRLSLPGDGGLSSSGLETAALVMRTALQALLAGEPVPAVEPAADETPSAPAHAAPRPRQRPDPPPAPPAPQMRDAGAPLGVRLFAGLQGMVDGSGVLGRQGAVVQLGIGLPALELGAAAALSLPNTERDELGELTISRHDALATVALRVAGDERLALWAGSHAGVALFHRTTRPQSDRLSSSAANLTPSLVIGPALALRLMDGSLGLGLWGSLDVMPDPPSFVYEGGVAPDRLAFEPPVLSARIALGLQARLR